MPVVIYVVAILVVACGFCTWFFVYRAKDEKRKKRILSDLEKVEEEKVVKKAEEEREKEKGNSLEDFEISQPQNPVEEQPQEENETSEDEEIEERFKRYEQFLRERLSSSDDDAEEDDENSSETEEREEREETPFEQEEKQEEAELSDFELSDEAENVNVEAAFGNLEDDGREKLMRQQRFRKFLPRQRKNEDEVKAKIKQNINDRRASDGLEPLEEEDVTVISSQAKQEAEEEFSVRRDDLALQNDQMQFTEEDVRAIQNFDIQSAKGKSMREIQSLLSDLPPRARKFLLSEILKARSSEEE